MHIVLTCTTNSLRQYFQNLVYGRKRLGKTCKCGKFVTGVFFPSYEEKMLHLVDVFRCQQQSIQNARILVCQHVIRIVVKLLFAQAKKHAPHLCNNHLQRATANDISSNAHSLTDICVCRGGPALQSSRKCSRDWRERWPHWGYRKWAYTISNQWHSLYYVIFCSLFLWLIELCCGESREEEFWVKEVVCRRCHVYNHSIICYTCIKSLKTPFN